MVQFGVVEVTYGTVRQPPPDYMGLNDTHIEALVVHNEAVSRRDGRKIDSTSQLLHYILNTQAVAREPPGGWNGPRLYCMSQKVSCRAWKLPSLCMVGCHTCQALIIYWRLQIVQSDRLCKVELTGAIQTFLATGKSSLSWCPVFHP